MRDRPRAAAAFVAAAPWLPVAAGVLVMLGLLAVALHGATGPRVPSAAPPVPPAVLPPAPPLAGPEPSFSAPAEIGSASPASTSRPPSTAPGGGSRSRSAVPASPAPGPASIRPDPPTGPAPPPEPAPPAVSGTYRVVQSYPGGFIGEVLVSNRGSAPAGWTVRLRFGPDVGPLHTFWVESAPQATLQTAGDTFVFTAGAPVPPGGQVALRFQVGRSGAAERPSFCTVDSTACAGG